MRALDRIPFGLSACAIAAGCNSQLHAEEILEKAAARFLGWQTSTTEFVTCEKNVVTIETGKVIKTIAKCQGPVFSSRGQMLTVKAVDADSRTFRMVDEKGDSLSVFYPEVAEKPTAMKFSWIKPGQVVGVDFFETMSKKYGRVLRAESITEFDKTPR